MKQPEALRLAEFIEADMTIDGDAEIAAELRRQHGEIEAMRSERVGNEKELRRLRKANQELLDALKEAEPMLVEMLKHIKAHLGDNYKMPALDIARAAIANEAAHRAKIDAAITAIQEQETINKIIGIGPEYRPCEHDTGEWREDEDGICVEFADGNRDCFYLSQLHITVAVQVQAGAK